MEIFVYFFCETSTLSCNFGMQSTAMPSFHDVPLTVVQGILVCQHIFVSGATGVRCCIDAKDNQPRPNLVYHLNSSESSPIENAATLTMTIPFPLQEALRDSITSGSFVDTKFWLFSKRASKPGRVGDTKPLFVNGHVTKRVPRLASRAAVFSCSE